VLWVGVRRDHEIAADREIAPGDRVIGMAASQAEVVHTGVVYDSEVDTSHTESLDCARAIPRRSRASSYAGAEWRLRCAPLDQRPPDRDRIALEQHDQTVLAASRVPLEFR
jgi:hypothetical protein